MALDRNGVAWLFPHAATVSAEGEFGFDSTDRSFNFFIGGVERRAAGMRYCRTTTYTRTNTAAEGTAVSDTIAAGTWAAKKTWRATISGQCAMNGGGAARSSILRVKLGGTTLSSINIGWNGSGPGFAAGTQRWVTRVDITCRSRAGAGTTIAYCVTSLVEDTIGGVTGQTVGDVAAGTLALDTTAAQNFVVTVQHSDASSSWTTVEQSFVWEA